MGNSSIESIEAGKPGVAQETKLSEEELNRKSGELIGRFKTIFGAQPALRDELVKTFFSETTGALVAPTRFPHITFDMNESVYIVGYERLESSQEFNLRNHSRTGGITIQISSPISSNMTGKIQYCRIPLAEGSPYTSFENSLEAVRGIEKFLAKF